MFEVLTILRALGYILIFPGFLFCFLLGLLLTGVERKVVAKMQKRVGPPLIQPFYDFFKLCGKETILPAAANKTVFLAAPLLGLSSLIVLQLFIPIFSFSAFSSMADVIIILYLLLLPAVAIIMGGAASGSPYAGVGLSREMVTVIACELPLVLVLLAVGKTVGNAMGEGIVFSMSKIMDYQLQSGSLILHPSMIPAAIAFLLVIPGETGSHPFDTAEAETEICEGMLAEYSGGPLAVFHLNHSVKIVTLCSLFVALFLGGLGRGFSGLGAALGLNAAGSAVLAGVLCVLLLVVLCLIITALFLALIHAVTARLKIEQVFKYYWTTVTAIAAVSLVLAWYGL